MLISSTTWVQALRRPRRHPGVCLPVGACDRQQAALGARRPRHFQGRCTNEGTAITAAHMHCVFELSGCGAQRGRVTVTCLLSAAALACAGLDRHPSGWPAWFSAAATDRRLICSSRLPWHLGQYEHDPAVTSTYIYYYLCGREQTQGPAGRQHADPTIDSRLLADPAVACLRMHGARCSSHRHRHLLPTQGRFTHSTPHLAGMQFTPPTIGSVCTATTPNQHHAPCGACPMRARSTPAAAQVAGSSCRRAHCSAASPGASASQNRRLSHNQAGPKQPIRARLSSLIKPRAASAPPAGGSRRQSALSSAERHYHSPAPCG